MLSFCAHELFSCGFQIIPNSNPKNNKMTGYVILEQTPDPISFQQCFWWINSGFSVQRPI